MTKSKSGGFVYPSAVATSMLASRRFSAETRPSDPVPNDCFKLVSQNFDRITCPEQSLTPLLRALAVMTDPLECGPVTLAFCQDIEAQAYDWPESFFERKV